MGTSPSHEVAGIQRDKNAGCCAACCAKKNEHLKADCPASHQLSAKVREGEVAEASKCKEDTDASSAVQLKMIFQKRRQRSIIEAKLEEVQEDCEHAQEYPWNQQRAPPHWSCSHRRRGGSARLVRLLGAFVHAEANEAERRRRSLQAGNQQEWSREPRGVIDHSTKQAAQLRTNSHKYFHKGHDVGHVFGENASDERGVGAHVVGERDALQHPENHDRQGGTARTNYAQ
eukprot:CAMPEP_0181480500 /NCGR_PEP_ID=MMETSP1110-20121109/43833_1 /TAXON_ID=174948 /ORGANISM="Symbiodinium sp., Strain CCMP421" /LENGTH=229 /DNA_ID=CAMNT_0023605973 /DNA_START=114 /DNA_END=800 /DNA_ORIENTATION=+